MSNTTLPVLVDHPLLGELTLKERAFVTHPLVAKDPRQAAADAGYNVKNPNNTWPYVKARQLQDYIFHYERQRLAVHDVTAETLRDELAIIGYSDMADYLDVIDTADNTITVPKDIKKLPPRLRKAIKHVHFIPPIVNDAGVVVIEGRYEIELHSKIEALRELGKVLGITNSKKPTGGIDPSDAAQSQLLENLTVTELEEVNRVFLQASKRVTKARSKKQDAAAIPGEVVHAQET